MKRLFEKYQNDLRGLFWLALAVFLGAALISYSPLDSSLNSLAHVGRPKNLCGYFGSFLADMLYQAFGLPAWILVLGAARQSVFNFKARVPRRDGLIWWMDLILIANITCLLSLHLGDVRFFNGHVRIGGWLGSLLTSGLIKAVNEVGLAIILWSSLAGLSVFYTERTWSEIVRKPRTAARDIWDWTAIRSSAIFNWLKSPPALTRRSVATAAAPKESTKSFFKISESAPPSPPAEDRSTRPEPQANGPEDDVADDVDDLQLPITGFLTEQLRSRLTRAPKKITLSKMPRRVANWELPKLSLLEDPPPSRARLDEREIKTKARLLTEKLAQFSVRGDVVGIKPGPAVTMFEFKPAADVKISKITDLADDLSLALSSESVRIIAPIPGRDVVGIETSNSQRESVFVKDIIAQDSFWAEDTKLPLTLGRKADGEPRVVDLRKMPHLLVAGTTGSGKSVFIVSMITGLLFRHSPKTLKMILVDPKQVDLAAFNDIPHLIMPPIREAKKAVGALRWAIREMEKRYRSMSKFGARGLEAFNEIAENLSSSDVDRHAEVNNALEGSFHPESYYYQAQPYIVIVVEEFGDLMAVDKVNVEQAVVRLAQMARACGIHLVLAMQSPRKDVVTGLIKTNIPGRISFKVASKMDSRIILDEGGAERLLARGDMLYLAPGVPKPERHHGPYLTEFEIAQVVSSWKAQGEPEYDATAMKVIEGSGGGFDLDPSAATGGDGAFDGFDDDEIKDDRYDELLAWVASQKEVSASLLQRKFRLGYPRAARLMEIFEAEGVVGPANGSKPRQVLVRELPS